MCPSIPPSENPPKRRRQASARGAIRESQTGLASCSPCLRREQARIRQAATVARPARRTRSLNRTADLPLPRGSRFSARPLARRALLRKARRHWSASRCQKSHDRIRRDRHSNGEVLLSKRPLPNQSPKHPKMPRCNATSAYARPPQSLRRLETYLSSSGEFCRGSKKSQNRRSEQRLLVPVIPNQSVLG